MSMRTILPMRRVAALAVAATALLPVLRAGAQEPYRTPPEPVARILQAPPPPSVSIDPQRRSMLVLEQRAMPSVADLARPMLRLAGMRINPEINARHSTFHYTSMTIRSLIDDRETPVRTPEGARLGSPRWSPDATRFAFTVTTDTGVELWVGRRASGEAARVLDAELNPILTGGFTWMPDSVNLVVATVPSGRANGAPQRSHVPTGPVVQETSGRVAPVRTYQDLLEDEHEAALFDYYAAAQLRLLNTDNLRSRPLGEPGMITGFSASPSGDHLLVSRVERPYSYLVPYYAFPAVTEVVNLRTGQATQIARLPLRDQTPIGGVHTGPRSIQWCSTAETRLVWVEALDGGDPKAEAPHRDRVLALDAPFTGEPAELLRLEHRFSSLAWLDGSLFALVSEYDRDQRWTRTWMADLSGGDREPVLLFDRSVNDRYNHPGTPITSTTNSGHTIVHVYEGTIFLTGQGATPEGDRPFLHRYNLATHNARELWRNAGEEYESVVDISSPDASVIITRRESPTDPPNYFVHDLANETTARITSYEDPAVELQGVSRQLVTYQRNDGVTLSATLYLPADHREGDRLPLVVWAYPREFSDPETAGQVAGSPHRYTRISGSSHLFFLTQGYAIMDSATMPVIGDAETMNDTFIEQIVSSAQAAIDKAVEMGVADRDRVGVGGHSYGAFMTANLLAHSDIFRAGIARSGAYNRTLTPFGFQSEQRTFWEAPEIYFNLSPFMHAHKINEPILLIHGQIDNNSGTFPMQSERLYHAVKGHGGTARLVMLPYESHGYQAEESVLHVLAEMIGWFDRHVKGAETRTGAAQD